MCCSIFTLFPMCIQQMFKGVNSSRFDNGKQLVIPKLKHSQSGTKKKRFDMKLAKFVRMTTRVDQDIMCVDQDIMCVDQDIMCVE